jgi:hypothetical protein
LAPSPPPPPVGKLERSATHKKTKKERQLADGRAKSPIYFRASPTANRGGGHEREISNAGGKNRIFTEIDKCKPVLLGLSLAENLVKPLLSLYGTKWRERGYGY